MTRLQKKCFLFSVGMHVLLLVILIGSSAFRSKPEMQDMPILTMIPANILDRAGAGGGSPQPPAAAPQPPQPAPAPVQQQQPAPTPAQKPPPVMPVHAAEMMERPVRHVVKEREPEPVEKPLVEDDSEPKPTHKPHVIRPDFTPVSADMPKHKVKASETGSSAESNARAEARRLKQIAQAFGDIARHVQTSGAAGTVVDMPGQGGGESFAGYETVIYNAYFHAWITPDSIANKLAAADVKIVVARDGTILSAEIINRSGEAALDRSVDRALRAVQRLPAFPAGARDEQRSFLIRFNLEAKEG